MEKKEYDSKKDTTNHITAVQMELFHVVQKLKFRGEMHDASKLEGNEKKCFDEITPKLKDLEYGTEEYMTELGKMQSAIDEHYDKNKHHPEHFENGIEDMSIIDLIEMLCDWNAARQRHTNKKTFLESLEINTKRFNIPEPIVKLIKNTAVDMMWT